MPVIITPGAITCKLRFGGNWGYFDDLLGRLTLGVSCCRKRERSGRLGKEAVSPPPTPLRTARASFPACRSSRLTCRHAGRSEDPKAPALGCPLGLCPVSLVPGRVRRATVVRCHWWPYRSDRVSH